MVDANTLNSCTIGRPRISVRVPEAPERSQREIQSIGALWCKAFHNSFSHPVCGSYRCWICLREFRVQWTDPR